MTCPICNRDPCECVAFKKWPEFLRDAHRVLHNDFQTMEHNWKVYGAAFTTAANTIAGLEQELADALESIVYGQGHQDPDGWIDSMAMSDVCDAGDRLVELGLWDRKDGGYGRRQWYRPKALAAKESGE